MTKIKANPDCPYCHGSGIVYDSVPYGNTNVQMPSVCETCIEWNLEQGNITEEEMETVELWPCDDDGYPDDPDSLPGGPDYY